MRTKVRISRVLCHLVTPLLCCMPEEHYLPAQRRFRMEKGKTEAQDFASELQQPLNVGGRGGGVGGQVLSSHPSGWTEINAEAACVV